MTKAERIRQHPRFEQYASSKAVWLCKLIASELRSHGVCSDDVYQAARNGRGGRGRPRVYERCETCGQPKGGYNHALATKNDTSSTDA